MPQPMTHTHPQTVLPSSRSVLRAARRAALAAAVLAGAPALALAQEVADSRTHVVKEGDTLWDIARMYLGDPFLWPEIYRLNTEVVEDPHWIYPGEVLRIGGEAGPIVAEGPVEPAGETVFGRRVAAPARSGARSLIGRTQMPAVRAGEYQAAPFIEKEGGPSGAGMIVESGEVPGIALISRRSRLQFQEKVFVRPPANTNPVPGDRYLAYKLGPMLDGLGQVIIPTGILSVEKAGNGEATTARVTKQFEEVKMGERLIPLDTFFLPSTARPTSVELGVHAKVVWIQRDPVLPSLQRYVVMNVSAKDGVHLGDQFTILDPAHEIDGGDKIPERSIAVAQVVRVTPYAATAIVIAHEQPAIREGAAARVTAKMP